MNQAPKERPILFSAPMVCAILAGKKTQTRRAIKPQPGEAWAPQVGLYHPTVIDRHGEERPGAEVFGAADECEGRRCPYGMPGERLWVRETFRVSGKSGAYWLEYAGGGEPLPIDDSEIETSRLRPGAAWRPSIFMPRYASRITLEVVSIRAARLFEMKISDAEAEGLSMDDLPLGKPLIRGAFRELWDSINGKTFPWDSNPWVWVVDFKRI